MKGHLRTFEIDRALLIVRFNNLWCFMVPCGAEMCLIRCSIDEKDGQSSHVWGKQLSGICYNDSLPIPIAIPGDPEKVLLFDKSLNNGLLFYCLNIFRF